MKSRGVYETPGGTLLHHAHRAGRVADPRPRGVPPARRARAALRRDGLQRAVVQPEREALQSFMDSVQTRVNGEARLKLYKGAVTIDGRRSPTHTLYDHATATFEATTSTTSPTRRASSGSTPCGCGRSERSASRRASEPGRFGHLRARFGAPVWPGHGRLLLVARDRPASRAEAERSRASIAHATMLARSGSSLPPKRATCARARGAARGARLGGLAAGARGRGHPRRRRAARHRQARRRGAQAAHARSRNDQIATDVRLWLVRALGELGAAADELIRALLDRVEADGPHAAPRVHAPPARAQPILLGHHLLAHAVRSRPRPRALRRRARRRRPRRSGLRDGRHAPPDRPPAHGELLGLFAQLVENAMGPRSRGATTCKRRRRPARSA